MPKPDRTPDNITSCSVTWLQASVVETSPGLGRLLTASEVAALVCCIGASMSCLLSMGSDGTLPGASLAACGFRNALGSVGRQA